MDRAAFERLYCQHGAMVFRRARTILGRDEDAEDIVQEVFQTLLERPTVIHDVESAVSWFYRITTNRSLNRLRSEGRREKRHTAAADFRSLPAGSSPEAVTLLRELIGGMPEREAATAIHYYMDRMTFDEIAFALGVSRRTVANSLKRFRKAVDKLAKQAKRIAKV